MPQALEAHFEHWHHNPPAPFNPESLQLTRDETEAGHAAYAAYSETLDPSLPEAEKRVLRAAFYAGYWDAFKTKRAEAA
jgi:hypothetical protein